MSRKSLIIILVILLFGVVAAGYGWNNGYIPGSPIKRNIPTIFSGETKAKFEAQVVEAKSKVQADSDDFNSWIVLGSAQYQLGKLADAVFSYKEAGKIKTKNSLSFSNLGDVYVKMGKIQQARNAYEQALDNDVRNDLMYRRLGEFLAQYYPDDKEDIEALYQRGIQELGLNHNVVSVFADWRERSGNLIGARDLWEQLLTLSPGNPAIQQRVTAINNKLTEKNNP